MCDNCRCDHRPAFERKQPNERKRQILNAAMSAAREHGYANITRGQVAESAGVSVGLVSLYFYSMPALKDAVMAEAIRLEVLEVLLQGIAAKDPIAQSAPADLRAAALESYA